MQGLVALKLHMFNKILYIFITFNVIFLFAFPVVENGFAKQKTATTK